MEVLNVFLGSVFLLLLSIAAGQTVLYNVDGVGTPSGSPMMKQWAFSYSLLKPDTSLTFTPVSGAAAFNTLAGTCRKNFQTDYILSDINWKTVNGLSDTIAVFPFFASAVVIPYNVPEIAAANGRLILTRELLYQIFSESLTMWNDPRLKLANPSLNLPAQPIRLIVRSDNNGVTTSLTSLLVNVDSQNHSKAVGYTAYFNWQNHTFLNATNTTSAFAMASTILTTNYSLGYGSLSYADQAGLPYAQLYNRNNQPCEPTDSNVAAAMSAALNKTLLSGINNIAVSDNPGDNSYPLPTVVYIAFQKYVDIDCPQRREVWKFLNWIVTSDGAAAQIGGTVGYSGFDLNSRLQILAQFTNITCQGKHLLADDYSESSSSVLRQAAMSISAILLTLVIIIGLTMGLKRNNRITKAAGLAFASCFLLGCLFNYIAVFLWAQVPNTDKICESRYILVSLGYTLLLGSMFAKCWEIRKIFARAETGDISPIQELPWWKFCQVFFSVISVNALLLLGLSAADPPKTMVHTVDDLNLIAIHMCYVFHTKTWVALEFTYFASLVLWGGYLAYSTREIWEKYNYPNESRSILLSIYNLVFCLSILLPLMTILAGNLEVVFFFVATAIIFPTTFALFSVYGPKMLVFLGSSLKGSNVTKQSKQKESGGMQGNLPDRMKDRAKDPEENSRNRRKDHRDDVILEESQHGQDQGRQSPPLTSTSLSLGTAGMGLSPEWRVLRPPVEDHGLADN